MMTGVDAADIDGDGDLDVISGGYSRGSRSEDSDVDVAKPMGRIAWFQNPGIIGEAWTRHDISRRQRGMFDMFVARDLDKDGDVDFVSTRGNSGPYDGVFWLEQVRTNDRYRCSIARAKVTARRCRCPSSIFRRITRCPVYQERIGEAVVGLARQRPRYCPKTAREVCFRYRKSLSKHPLTSEPLLLACEADGNFPLRSTRVPEPRVDRTTLGPVSL